MADWAVGEEWKTIQKRGCMYEVSNLGRVRRNGRDIYRQNLKGYIAVYGHLKGRRYAESVHVLVLEAFVGPRPAGFDACHSDGDRANNALSNLRWASRVENMADQYRHGTRVRGHRVSTAKLSYEIAETIRRRHASGDGMRSMGREYGVSHTVISAVITGKSWARPTGAI